MLLISAVRNGIGDEQQPGTLRFAHGYDVKDIKVSVIESFGLYKGEVRGRFLVRLTMLTALFPNGNNINHVDKQRRQREPLALKLKGAGPFCVL